MKRREFLKSTLPAAALLQAGLCGAASPSGVMAAETQAGGGFDLVVIGGTLSACFAALHAAKEGAKVLLVERRTFLATEITAPMRPWLQRVGYDSLAPELKELLLPAAEQDEVGVPFDPTDESGFFGDEIPLFMGSVKKQFMAVLRQNGVQILVGTGVWGVLADDAQQAAAGVAVASKFGLHTIRGQRILDASLSGERVASQANGQVAYTLELYGVSIAADVEVSVPKSLGLVNDKVYVHKGKRKPGHRFVEFRFRPRQKDVEHEARQKAEQLAAHVIQEQATFAKATIVQMGWETLAIPEERAACEAPAFANYECLRYGASPTLSCQDVADAYHAARARVESLLARREPRIEPSCIVCDLGTIPLTACQAASTEDSQSDEALQQITLPANLDLPETHRADVVVAGGGTAGAMAALGAVRDGARTVTLEYLPELGGTSTVGRVTGFYGAYKDTRFFEMIEDGVNGQSRLAGRCARGVARMLYYRKQATEADGTLLTGVIICDVVREGEKVTGVVVEQGGKLSAIMGQVVIDATGDGDVAAFAGADFAVGNERMQCTQNYSQWDVNPGVAAWKDSSTNRDYDILWSHIMSEWQRGYQLSHHQSHYYDFTPFLTVRECRRITGDYTITLRDVVQGRRHADAICLAKSDFDPHHFGDTAYSRAGCLLPHQVTEVVEIPYRAILPRGIDNLLISAKAISQTHNALQFTRMSFDIMTLGYVTGRIAASVVKQGIAPRDFDVSTLQDELREWKILPDSPIADSATTANRDSITVLVEELTAGTSKSLLRIMVEDRQVAVPALRRAFDQSRAEEQQLRLAKALAWFGNPIGNELILREMQRLFREEQATGHLPREYYREDKATDYWTINQDIALLGLSGDAAVLPHILALADSLELGNPPVRQATAYNRGRIDLRLIPYYNRIITICFAIERMPAQSAAPTLHRLLDDPYIRDHVTKAPQEAGDKIYGGILESRLAATAARCGDDRGFSVLAEYLQDVHPMLARYAGRELASLLHAKQG